MHEHEHHHKDTKKVINRLRRIEGQISGIIKMVEGGKPCEDVLIQISSAKSALHKTGQVVLEDHMYSCIKNAIKNGDEDAAIENLLAAVEQFSRII